VLVGVPVLRQCVAFLVRRASSSLAGGNPASLDKLPPAWQKFVVHSANLSNEIVKQLWRYAAGRSCLSGWMTEG
jgi:hypothetical protein